MTNQPPPLKKFEIVDDESPTSGQTSRTDQVGINLLALGLQTLSQRALTSIKALFTCGSVASAFWLWLSIPDPSVLQIISLSLYAIFVLTANVIVRRG